MKLADIAAHAERARTVEELRRAVVDWMLADIQREAERRNEARTERTQRALLKGVERQARR